MKDKPIAFDDSELGDWQIELIEDGSNEFLSALAEAVVTADTEHYGVLCPALVELKSKYYDGAKVPAIDL